MIQSTPPISEIRDIKVSKYSLHLQHLFVKVFKHTFKIKRLKIDTGLLKESKSNG